MKLSKFIFLIFFFFLIEKVTYGQTGELNLDVPLPLIDQTDLEFPGGTQKVREIISQNLHYPETAIKDSLGGKVFVTFMVDTLGNTINAIVVKGVRKDLDEEAVRIVILLKGWIPATREGKKIISHKLTLPITFKLP